MSRIVSEDIGDEASAALEPISYFVDFLRFE